jgi:hypothetical protein
MDESNLKHSSGQWMKLAQASRHLGLSEITLRRKVKKKQIQARMFEGRYFIWVKSEQIQSTLSPDVLSSYKKTLRKLQRQLADQESLIKLLEEKNSSLLRKLNQVQK